MVKARISLAKTRASASESAISSTEDFDPFSSDYAANEALDAYSDTGIDDAQDFEGMTGAQRRAAERAMVQRDMREHSGRRGARAAARSRGPDFLLSDGLEDEDDVDGGLLSGMKRRTRRQYDERKDMDDLDGIEDVSPTVGVSTTSDINSATGAANGTTWRHQSEIHRGVDRHGTCPSVDCQAFSRLPRLLRGPTWGFCLWRKDTKPRRK